MVFFRAKNLRIFEHYYIGLGIKFNTNASYSFQKIISKIKIHPTVEAFSQSLTFEMKTATIPAINKKGARKLPRMGNIIGSAKAISIAITPIV